MSKTWTIPVTWEMCGTVKVSADTLEEAVRIVREDDDDIPLPTDTESGYVDGSFQPSSEDISLFRECYNNNQQDEKTEEE